MQFYKISEGVKILCKQMLDFPEDWRQGMYEFKNIKHQDIFIWTANGSSFIKLNGNDGFTFAEKIFINNSIKKSIALRLSNFIN